MSVDFTQAPIVVDLELIRRLRRQLHAVRKTFNGKEFVDNLLSLTAPQDVSESSANEMTTHQSICYSSEYAIELGQYLLEAGLLSLATTNLVHATPNPSEIEASADGVLDKRTFSLASFYRFTEAEDRHINIRKHQVCQAVKEKMNKKQQQQPLEERGRLGTLSLISDILIQRSHHERRLKEFINSNKFQEVTRELSNNNHAHTVTCLCIVHL